MRVVTPGRNADPIRPPPCNYCCVGRGHAECQTGVGGVGERFVEQVLGNEIEESSGELVEAEEEEAQQAASLPTPYMPTQSERDDHELTHATYRSWCEHCVQGRGVEMGHHQVGDHSERGVPVVGFDYMFVTRKDAYTRDDWKRNPEGDVDPSQVLKILVVRDMKSKSVFAHAVRAKGSDEEGYAVQCLVDNIQWLGYSRLILKSDNEPSIVRLLRDALKVLRVQGVDQVCEEHPPPYDPQANGGIEVGVKLVKGHFKTLRSSLEARVGYKIPVAHPIMTWLVGHSANILTWFSRGKDGRTAYQRVRGRTLNAKLLMFGESCRYKCRSHEPLHGRERWSAAIYLGRESKQGQHILFDGATGSVAHARTLMRLPNAQKWSAEAIAAVSITPWSLHEPSKPEVIFRIGLINRGPMLEIFREQPVAFISKLEILRTMVIRLVARDASTR